MRMNRPLTQQQEQLEASKQRLLARYPEFGDELFAFLERDQSTICYANLWQSHLGAVRVAPSAAIASQFDISLEVPVLIATFGRDRALEPRVLRHLDTSNQLRGSTTADKDIAVIVASDNRVYGYVQDRKRFSYPILVLHTEDLIAGKYRASNLRTEIGKLMRSVNHFDYSNEIRESADFFGRVAEVEALTALGLSGQSVGVFGLRRAGKTSLLYRVADALQERETQAIYIQLNLMHDADHLRESLVEATARLLRSQGGRVPVNSEMLNPDFSVRSSDTVGRRWVFEMDALLDQIEADVVLMIDETDLANEDTADLDDLYGSERKDMNRVLQQLRGLIQIRNDRGRRRLSFLTAGVAASIYTSAVRFGRDNQLFGFASARPLGPMSRDEMRQMVRTLGKRSGLKFDGHNTFNSLFDEYGGHPHLTRQACSAVAEAVQRRQGVEVPYRVQMSDLKAAYESMAEGAPAQAAWETFLSFTRWYPEEAALVTELLKSGEPLDVDAATHAVGFGICDETGALRMRALQRSAARGLV